MIQYAYDDLKPILKLMWKLCFSDSDKYIKFYFDNVYKNEETIVFFHDNKVVSSLQMIPYQIKLRDNLYDAIYISGAMTHPQFRGKSYMKQLLVYALNEMKNKKIHFSFLIPQETWLFDYYKKFGFEKAFPFSKEIYKSNIELKTEHNKVKVIDHFPVFYFETLYNDYLKLLSENENVILKSKEQFRNIIIDLFLDNGRIFMINDVEKGLAFVVFYKNQIIIKELLSENEKSHHLLIEKIFDYYKYEEMVVFNRKNSQKSILKGMINIIDPELNSTIKTTNIYMSMMLD